MQRSTWDDPEALLSVDDAFQRIIGDFAPLPPIAVELVQSIGHVLSQDVISSQAVPPFNNSAMDGFALRSIDTVPSRLARLRVTGTAAAGRPSERVVSHGEAIRIMTGAVLPDGADAVVRFEEAEIDETGPVSIVVRREVVAGENVRFEGEDLQAGDVVLQAGTVMSPSAIGVLASIGEVFVTTHRIPRVGILSTGDEVIPVGTPLQPGQVYDANASILHAKVLELGAEIEPLGIANDDRDELRERLRHIEHCDLLISSGGVSHGDFDLVKDVLAAEGSVDFWSVRMKPGKPLAFGTLRGVPFLGLPGNPAAAAVSFDQFARPAIRRMMGYTDIRLPEVQATLLEPIENRGRRRHFERGIVEHDSGRWQVKSTGIHGSAMVSGLRDANCYIVVPETVEMLNPGESVSVQLLPQMTSPPMRAGLQQSGNPSGGMEREK